MHNKATAYIGLFFVVIIWGLTPMFTLSLYNYYSPTFKLLLTQPLLIAVYLLMSRRHYREFNSSYIKIGLATGFFYAIADVCQKAGLPYTTPAKYAFLENLLCVTVPPVTYFLTRKRPTVFEIIAAFLCLAGAFVLNGVSANGFGIGIGDILCGIAGLMYGFSLAGVGAYAKKLYTPLLLAVQAFAELVVTAVAVPLLNGIYVNTSSAGRIPIEEIKYSFALPHLLFLAAVSLVCSALCLFLRTNSMKYIKASTVSVIVPFSAVVTSIVSFMRGSDTLSSNLVYGGILCMAAILISEFKPPFRQSK